MTRCRMRRRGTAPRTRPAEGSAPPRALVVGPRRADGEAAAAALAEAGFAVDAVRDGEEGWRRFRADAPDAVLAGLELPGLSGLDLLRRVRAVSTTPFLLQAQAPQVAAAIEAVRAGADEVVTLPDDLDELAARVATLVDRHSGGSAARVLEARVLGRSPAMVLLRERLRAVADLRVPLLLRGEPGTGRDHVVRALAASARKPARVVTVAGEDGAAAGSGTPASSTVFHLDEITRLSPAAQARWASRLRACERGESGPTERIVASTAADLVALAREGAFSAALAGRLSRFALDLPPLRERREDVGLLARSLAERAAARLGRPPVALATSALRRLQDRSWPGNVRELAAVVERLVAFAPDGLVTGAHVEAVLGETPASVAHLRRRAERRQRDELVELLDATDGNLAEVARRLGLSRGAVIYRAQKFGLLPKR